MPDIEEVTGKQGTRYLVLHLPGPDIAEKCVVQVREESSPAVGYVRWESISDTTREGKA